jgi:hypothetical protein
MEKSGETIGRISRPSKRKLRETADRELSLEEENQRLRAENEYLKAEREFLLELEGSKER